MNLVTSCGGKRRSGGLVSHELVALCIIPPLDNKTAGGKIPDEPILSIPGRETFPSVQTIISIHHVDRA